MSHGTFRRTALRFLDSRAFAFAVTMFIVVSFFVFSEDTLRAASSVELVPVNVNLTVCGDGIISLPEICDDGMVNGTYSVTIGGRFCNDTDCQSYAEYCGDLIVQPIFSEECDDGNNIDDDGCSAVCLQEGPLGGGGGGGGLGPFNPGVPIEPVDTSVIVRGKAYPNVSVNVLQDGVVVGVVEADAKADFFFQTEEVTPGITTFSFWAEDIHGLQSVSLSMTFRIAPNAVTTVSGAHIPPTIGLENNVVDQGEVLLVFGQTIPDVGIFVQTDEGVNALTVSGSDAFGTWAAEVDTSELENEQFHTAGAYFEGTDSSSGAFLQSGFGRFVSFFVGLGQGDEDNCERSDINDDARVNLIDFSILLFNWGSANTNSDINLDGAVNLIDFSIQLFCWTG